MDIFDENIKKEVKDYEKNINSVNDETFLSQFKLQEINGLVEGSKERYNKLSNPSIYNPHRDFSMLEANRFENLNMAPSGRRDNTLVINENFNNLKGKKIETNLLKKSIKNVNATLASGVLYNQNLDSFKNRLYTKVKNNHYDKDTMFLRTELIDGVPINENVRSLPKNQEQLRTNTINSQKLAPDGKQNNTGKAITRSRNPEEENLTKFKLQTYREQKTSDDFIKTTGQILKPQARSKIEISTNRSVSRPIIGGAKTIINKDFFRNNQPMKKTIKEDNVIKTHIVNTKSVVDKPSYHNNQEARSTDRGKNNEHISNLKSEVDKSYYKNNQLANKTLRETDNDQLTNLRSVVDKPSYHNNQEARYTDRETNNEHLTNLKSEVDKSYFKNNQQANKTLRETDNDQLTNVRSNVDSSYVKNNQPANETIREETQNNSFTGGATGFTKGNVYHNNQQANVTIKEQTVKNNYIGAGYNDSQGKVFKNGQEAQKTFRDIEGNKTGIAYSNSGNVYHNNNLANHTIRGDTGTTTYSGPSHLGNNRTYLKSIDKTRSGVVEEVLAKDYKGTSSSMVSELQSRDLIDNYEQYERLEQGLDLTNIEPIGGYGQISLGTNNFGKQTDKEKRGVEDSIQIPSSIVGLGNNHIIEKTNTYIETRDKESLQKRVNINPNLEDTLNGNPYINNNVFKSISKKDIIFEKTNKSDRVLDEVIEKNILTQIKY